MERNIEEKTQSGKQLSVFKIKFIFHSTTQPTPSVKYNEKPDNQTKIHLLRNIITLSYISCYCLVFTTFLSTFSNTEQHHFELNTVTITAYDSIHRNLGRKNKQQTLYATVKCVYGSRRFKGKWETKTCKTLHK